MLLGEPELLGDPELLLEGDDEDPEGDPEGELLEGELAAGASLEERLDSVEAPEGDPKLDAGLPAAPPPGGGTTLLGGEAGSLRAVPKMAAGAPVDGGGGAAAAVAAPEFQLMRRPVGQVSWKLRPEMVSFCSAASYLAVPADRFVTPGVLSTDAVCTVPGVALPAFTACTQHTLS